MILNPHELIFSPHINFVEKALHIFRLQYASNELYKRFVDSLNCEVNLVKDIEDIPCLPISFFKTHYVATTAFSPDYIFESSGTTGSINSRHFIKDISIYEKSFIDSFELIYGSIADYSILALLPSYLQRNNSSLVYMVQKMMQISGHKFNSFYLSEYSKLGNKLIKSEADGIKTLLIGVTYALLDFAEDQPMELKNTILMETGGMKGRKKEVLRYEVHEKLKSAFCLNEIHSEYGMTELLSQAYSIRDGIFKTPPWMQVMIREEDDPLKIRSVINDPVTGVINVIDLANFYSCSFIATDDIGRLLPDKQFEVLGRIDNSDIRGCSLLSL